MDRTLRLPSLLLPNAIVLILLLSGVGPLSPSTPYLLNENGPHGGITDRSVRTLTPPLRMLSHFGVAGAVAGAEVTIENSQSVAIHPPFQQLVTLNSTHYLPFLNANWSNAAFFYDNGTVIPAWIETGASNTTWVTTVWLNLSATIGANSNYTVFLMFFPLTADLLFPSGPTGEAPTLSATYGAHDNGPAVFLLYAPFQGSALPPGWTSKSISGTYTPAFVGTTATAGGVEMMNYADFQSTALEWGSDFSDPSIVIEASWGYEGQTGSMTAGLADDLGLGFYAKGVDAFAGAHNPPAEDGYYASYEFYDGSQPDLSYNGGELADEATQTMSDAAPGPYFEFSQVEVLPGSITMNLASSTSAIYEAGQYTGLQTLVTYTGTPSNANSLLYAGSSTGGTTSYQYLYWLRVRAAPPNGVMPETNASFPLVAGAVTPASASVLSGTPIQLNSSGVSGGVSPYTFQWYSESPGTSGCSTSNPIAGATGPNVTVAPTTATLYCYRVFDHYALNATSLPGLVKIKPPPAVLALVTISPPSFTVPINGTQALRATPTCTGSPCPAGITYLWTLNASLGTVTPGPMNVSTFIAGTSGGLVKVQVAATLNGTTQFDTSNGTIQEPPAPTVTSVALTPQISSVDEQRTEVLDATPTCSVATCPGGIQYTWGTNSTLGSVSPTSGFSNATTFTAGTSPGVVPIWVLATLGTSSTEGYANVTIPAPPVNTLQSVSLSPGSVRVTAGQSESFQASAACSLGACGTGVVYRWYLNDTLGTVQPSAGGAGTATFTAGAGAGLVLVTVNGSLNGTWKTASSTVTILPAPSVTLIALSISPTPARLNTSQVEDFLAVPTCSSNSCPAGIQYAWTLTNASGSALNTTTRESIALTTGQAETDLTLNATAELGASRASAQVSIEVVAGAGTKSPKAGSSGLGSDWLWLVLVAIAAAVLIGLLLVYGRRKKPAPEGPTPTKPESPPTPAAIDRTEWSEDDEATPSPAA